MNIKSLMAGIVLGMMPLANAELNLEIPETILSSVDSETSVGVSVNFSSAGLRRLRGLRRRGELIEDSELNAWIRSIGVRLLAQTPYKGRPLYFAIARDNQVNAYATQGGLIVINAGLIMRSNSESELASVIAHEIAHVTQQHIERMIARAKGNVVGNTAAVVAGLLIGSKNSEVGQAIVTSALALDAHGSLRFGRAAETEADREGLRILANAGFDPKAMPSFLGKLQDGVDPAYADIGQYLTSHPLSAFRVNDTRQRARRYGVYKERSQPNYYFMKQKLRILTDSPATLAAMPTYATQYAKNYQSYRQGDFSSVIQNLRLTATKIPEFILLSHAYLRKGQFQEAIQILQVPLRNVPYNESLIMSMTEALIVSKEYEQAWQWIKRVSLVEQISLDFLIIRQEAAHLSGRLSQAYLSVAERNIRMGEYRHALIQLQLALRVPEVTAEEKQMIQQATYRAKRFFRK